MPLLVWPLVWPLQVSSASGDPSGYGSAPAAECLPPAFLLILQHVPDAAGSVSSCLVQNEENNVENASNSYRMSFYYIFIFILYNLINDTHIYIYMKKVNKHIII